MPYSPLTDDRVFRYVFGEPEGLPLLESLINAFFEPVGIPKIHHLTLQNREVGPESLGEKVTLLDVLAKDEKGRIVNVEIQTTRKPAFFERTLFYWSRLYSRQLPVGEDYQTLKPVFSLNLLEYDISEQVDWLHLFRLPQTDHLGFVFVELRKLLRLVSEDPQYQNRASPDLKNAAIWGTFLEKPEKNWVIDQNAVAEMLLATRIRMEEFMALTPEIVYEIQKEMYEHDLASMRGEARRAGLAEGREEGREEGRVARSMEIARNLKVKGMSPVEIAELTGLPIPAIESL